MPQLIRRVATLSACAVAAGALAACSSGSDDDRTAAPETETAVTTTDGAGADESDAAGDDDADANDVVEEPSRYDRPSSHSSQSSASASATDDADAAANDRSDDRRDGGARNADDSAGDSGDGELEESVAEAYDIFSPLAPRAIFEQFTSCDPAGLEDSYNCSGPGVGQFQFFKSDTKATQTTQVLTELRSSHVVEDSGSRVVGWSTLGSTAVLTVVDNDEGLVMQQMVSTDQDDPEERLEELGLI